MLGSTDHLPPGFVGLEETIGVLLGGEAKPEDWPHFHVCFGGFLKTTLWYSETITVSWFVALW